MNTNRLYLATIYVVGTKILEDGEYNYYGKFCKNAVVYHNKNNEYIDIESKEKYIKGLINTYEIGDMYIHYGHDLIPIYQLPEINFERKNMSKRKILKKLSNTSLYNKKEEDK